MKTAYPIFFLLLCQTASAAKIAFEDLEGLVRNKNDNVQAAQFSFQSKEARTGYLVRSFLPSVSAQMGGEEFKGGAEPKQTREYWQVEANLNLFRGGRDLVESSIRKEETLKAQHELLGEYAQELKVAQQAYWRLVGTNQILAQKKASLAKNEESLSAARKRAGAGTATAADALQFELFATTLKQEIKKLELERDLLKNSLSVSIGRDEHEDLEVGGEFPHPEDHTLEWPALDPESSPSVAALKSQETIAGLGHAQAKLWWMPRVDAYAGYGVPALSDEFTRALSREKEWVAGIKIGLNIGEGFEGFYNSRSKAFEAASQEKRKKHHLRELVAKDHELRHDLKLIHDLMHDADADVKKAERFLALTRNEYNRGVKNGPDMLGAFQRYYEFQQRRTDLYREFHETKAELTAILANAKEE